MKKLIPIFIIILTALSLFACSNYTPDKLPLPTDTPKQSSDETTDSGELTAQQIWEKYGEQTPIFICDDEFLRSFDTAVEFNSVDNSLDKSAVINMVKSLLIGKLQSDTLLMDMDIEKLLTIDGQKLSPSLQYLSQQCTYLNKMRSGMTVHDCNAVFVLPVIEIDGEKAIVRADSIVTFYDKYDTMTESYTKYYFELEKQNGIWRFTRYSDDACGGKEYVPFDLEAKLKGEKVLHYIPVAFARQALSDSNFAADYNTYQHSPFSDETTLTDMVKSLFLARVQAVYLQKEIDFPAMLSDGVSSVTQSVSNFIRSVEYDAETTKSQNKLIQEFSLSYSFTRLNISEDTAEITVTETASYTETVPDPAFTEKTTYELTFEKNNNGLWMLTICNKTAYQIIS